MEHEMIRYDFFIESAKVNVEKTFSLDSEILLSENFDSYVMRTIFISKLPFLKGILKQNRVELPETMLYPLIKMRVDKVIEKFEAFLKECSTSHEGFNTAKTNLIKFKIGCILALVLLNHDYSRQWDLIREITALQLQLNCKSCMEIDKPEREAMTSESFIRQFICELPEVHTIKQFLVKTFQKLEIEASELEYFNSKCKENEEKEKEEISTPKKRSYADTLTQQGKEEDLANKHTESKKPKTIGDYFLKSSKGETLGFRHVKEFIETNKINLNNDIQKQDLEKEKEKEKEKETNFQNTSITQASLDEIPNAYTGCNYLHNTMLNTTPANANLDADMITHSMLSLPLKTFASQQGVLSNNKSTFYSTNSLNSNSKLSYINFDNMSCTFSETSNSNLRSNSGTVYQRGINVRLSNFPTFVNAKKHKHGNLKGIKRNPNKDQILEKLFDKVQSHTKQESQINQSTQEVLSSANSNSYLNLKQIVNKQFYSQAKTASSQLQVEESKESIRKSSTSKSRASKSNPHSNENSNLIPQNMEETLTGKTNLGLLEIIKKESVKKTKIARGKNKAIFLQKKSGREDEEVLVYKTPEKDMQNIKFGKRSPHLHSKTNLLNLFQQINEKN